jgi:3-carboxy-cis,cis-muconate cycloisomerase
MVQEHERAAGAWHAEWKPLSDLLTVTGSAAAWLRTSLEGLRVDAPRMRANLDATGGRLLAERVVAALDRPDARERVERAAASEGPFADALAAETGMPRAELDLLLDPVGYLGASGELVERALAQHRIEART